jgi:hypothetical protein
MGAAAAAALPIADPMTAPPAAPETADPTAAFAILAVAMRDAFPVKLDEALKSALVEPSEAPDVPLISCFESHVSCQ